MKDDTAAKDAARKTRREQWLRYLTFVAEEKICVSCSANRYKKWLSESPGYLICYIYFCFYVAYWQTLRTDYQNLLRVSFDCRCELDD